MSKTTEQLQKQIEIEEKILSFVLSEIETDDIEDVETNAGSCYINLKNRESYYIIVEKVEKD